MWNQKPVPVILGQVPVPVTRGIKPVPVISYIFPDQIRFPKTNSSFSSSHYLELELYQQE